MELIVQQIRDKITAFYDKLNELEDIKQLPNHIKEYIEVHYDPEQNKTEYIVAMCFKSTLVLRSDIKTACIKTFNELFPYQLGTPVLEQIPCEKSFRSVNKIGLSD